MNEEANNALQISQEMKKVVEFKLTILTNTIEFNDQVPYHDFLGKLI